MVLTWLTKYRDLGLLLLRLGVGGMFIFVHGWPKLIAGPTTWKKLGGSMQYLGIDFAPEMWGLLAALAEFGGGILLALGLLFRPACGALAFTMGVAALLHFRTEGTLFAAAHPIEIGVVFLALILIGPGRFSLDKS